MPMTETLIRASKYIVVMAISSPRLARSKLRARLAGEVEPEILEAMVAEITRNRRRGGHIRSVSNHLTEPGKSRL